MARYETFLIKNEDVSDWIKAGLEKIKSFINTLFNKLSGLLPGEVVSVLIPSPENVSEGAAESIKGNYNEALVCKLINDLGKKPNVDINYKKYSKEIEDTESKLNYWKETLKKSKDISPSIKGELEKDIYKGSQEMALYLVGKARENDMTIVATWVENLAAKTIGSEFKGDIRVVLEKNGKEIYKDLSLKLYGGFEVGLINTSPVGLVRSLFGDSAASELKLKFLNHKKLSEYMEISGIIAGIMRGAKKGPIGVRKFFVSRFHEKLPKDINEKMAIDEIIKKIKGVVDDDVIRNIRKTKTLDGIVPILRSARGLSRTPINPIIADLTYGIVMKYYKNNFESFVENLLRIIGFTDKETGILMAVTERLKKGKRITIVDEHPELNLENIRIIHNPGTTNITIKSLEGGIERIILYFVTKEGEKQAVTGKVKFSRKDAVDMDKFTDLRKILGMDE